jgi:glycosyltransferase involved in cell wall biosynthesis
MITVVILTFNESLHIERCIRSVSKIAKDIIVVDSFSTDDTCEIAKKLGANVFQNVFINQANQFQWALDNCNIEFEWILRLDADEYLLKELEDEILEKLPFLPQGTNGVYLKRRVYFMNKWIKYGGYYPVKLLRLWRTGTAIVEQKWMDEHIILKSGSSIEFQNDFVDENFNTLQWWTSKHNNYSSRELIEYFNEKHNFFQTENISLSLNSQESKKRKYKLNFYNKSPLFLRSFIYFLFRYILQLGFLDGKKGLVWHFLQGFWYRFLIDSKIYQVNHIAKRENKSIKMVLIEDFNLKIE